MSSITTPAEIEVPREFLPAFAIAANLLVMNEAELLDSKLSLDYSEDNRRADDRAMEAMTWAIDARAAVLRAIDDRAPVSVAVLEILARSAVEHVDGDARKLIDAEDGEGLVAMSRLLRDLRDWIGANDLAPVLTVPA